MATEQDFEYISEKKPLDEDVVRQIADHVKVMHLDFNAYRGETLYLCMAYAAKYGMEFKEGEANV